MEHSSYIKIALSIIIVLLIANIFLQLRTPDPVSAQTRRKYQVRHLGTYGNKYSDIDRRLNEISQEGWRLVTVENGDAYFEK